MWRLIATVGFHDPFHLSGNFTLMVLTAGRASALPVAEPTIKGQIQRGPCGRGVGEVGFHSPVLPLFIVALHVWSDLLGEPLVLSELGFSVTCSSFVRQRNKRLKFNYRNKRGAGTSLCQKN